MVLGELFSVSPRLVLPTMRHSTIGSHESGLHREGTIDRILYYTGIMADVRTTRTTTRIPSHSLVDG